MAAVPAAVQHALKDLGGSNVQLKLALISDDPDLVQSVAGGGDNNTMYSRDHRYNIKVLDDNGVTPIAQVPLYYTENVNFNIFQSATSPTFALVAIVGKNHAPEFCVILTFFQPNYAQHNKAPSKDMSAQNTSTSASTKIANHP